MLLKSVWSSKLDFRDSRLSDRLYLRAQICIPVFKPSCPILVQFGIEDLQVLVLNII
jgi:hypothetical protein